MDAPRTNVRATIDIVRDTFRQVLGSDPAENEEAYWVDRFEAAENHGEAIDDLVETLLLRINNARSILHLHMCFFDRPPDDRQLRIWGDRFAEIRASHPHKTDKEALILTVQQWLASERNRTPRFGAENFRSILFLKLLF